MANFSYIVKDSHGVQQGVGAIHGDDYSVWIDIALAREFISKIIPVETETGFDFAGVHDGKLLIVRVSRT